MEQVQDRSRAGFATWNGSRIVQGKIETLNRYQDRSGGGFVTFDRYQDRSGAGFVTLSRYQDRSGEGFMTKATSHPTNATRRRTI